MPITILDVAKARGVKDDPEGITLGAIEDVGLPAMGGCSTCEASLAAYNMYPSTTGYVKCEDCIGDRGFDTVEAFEAFSKESETHEKHSAR